MQLFDDPGLALAIVAVILGLRLALFVIERILRNRSVRPSVPALSPDDNGDVLPTVKVAALVSEQAKHTDEKSFLLLTEVLDSALIALGLVFLLIRPFILQAFFIPSESMVPTLQKGDKLLATKYSYYLHEPKTGDIVVFQAPRLALQTLQQTYDAKRPVDYVKRVIGVPGNRIHIEHQIGVYINGKLLHEPYVAAKPNYDFPLDDYGNLVVQSDEVRTLLKPNIHGKELIVPRGYLFVLGDNRTFSHDSHVWGLVPRKALIGKAAFIFWPLKRIGIIK